MLCPPAPRWAGGGRTTDRPSLGLEASLNHVNKSLCGAAACRETAIIPQPVLRRFHGAGFGRWC